MHAIVSLFDTNVKALRSLSSMLEKNFGTRLYAEMPDPHISYQGATNYDFSKLEHRLRSFAERTSRFQIRVGGLGVFTGFTPTLYIPVVRTSELSQLQLGLWRSISSTGSGLNALYKPEAWVPHIALARSVSERTLTKVIRSLARKEIELDLKIDNLAIIEFDGKAHTVRSKFQLR
jgi:2'-5' RNA ligase